MSRSRPDRTQRAGEPRVCHAAAVDWWNVLAIAGGALVADLAVVPWVQRRIARRRLQAGHPIVAARSLAPARGTLPARWTPCRIDPEDGRLVLRQLHDLWTVRGFDLITVAGPDRRLAVGELMEGARRALPAASSAGPVELAAPDEVLSWVESQLAPAAPA